MKTYLKTIALVFSVLVLSACGGGGDDTPKKPAQVTPVNNPLRLSAASLRVDVDENSAAQYQLSYTGADGTITLSVDTSDNGETPEWLSLDLSNPDMITVNVGEIKKEHEQRITLVADDGTDTSSMSFAVHGTNTSVVPLLEELGAYQVAVGNYVAQSEELEYAKRALDLASMTNGAANPTLVGKLKRDLNSAINSPSSESLVQASQQSLESEYASGLKNEDDIVAALEEIKAETEAFSAEVGAVLSNIVALLPESKMALDVSSPYMLTELSSLSRFVGNPALGEFVSGEWTFKAEYAFFEAIITPSSLPCNAQ